jgi:hypothetical protein
VPTPIIERDILPVQAVWRCKLSRDKTIAIVMAGTTRARWFYLLSHCAFCLGAAPFAHVGHVDEAVGEQDWFAVD